MSSVVPISEFIHFERTITSDRLSVIVYFSETCYPCHMFRPVFEQIAESTGVIEDVDFYSVNCTDAPREMYPAIEAIKSQGVPAVGVFSRGDLFAEVSGFIPLGEFRRWLSECMTLRGQQYSDEQTVRAQQVMKTVQSMQVGGEPVIIPVKDGNRFKSLIDENNALVLGYYKSSAPVASEKIWSTIVTLISQPTYGHVRYAFLDCEGLERTTNAYLLDHQSQCYYSHARRIISMWKSSRNADFAAWLEDCVRAGALVDSIIRRRPADNDVSAEMTAEGDCIDDDALDNDNIGSDDSHDNVVRRDQRGGELEGTGSEQEYSNDSEDDDSGDDLEQYMIIADEAQWQETLSNHQCVVVIVFNHYYPLSVAISFIAKEVALSGLFKFINFCAVDHMESVPESLEGNEPASILLFREKIKVAAHHSEPMDQARFENWLKDNFSSLDTGNNPDIPSVEEAEGVPPKMECIEDIDSHDLPPVVAAMTMKMAKMSVSSKLSPAAEDVIKASIPKLDIVGTSSSDDDDLLSPAPPYSAIDIPLSQTQTDTQTQPALSPTTVGHTPLLQAENHSSTSLSTVASTVSSLLQMLPPCHGSHQDRPLPRFRLLGKRKPFLDPEPGCKFVMSEDGEGLQIGRANEGDSYFNITLSYTQEDVRNAKVALGVGFCPDVNIDARFVSAVFRVTFWYYDAQERRLPLKIRELYPTDLREDEADVHIGRGSERSASLNLGYSSASVGSTATSSKSAEYTRKTYAQVRGQGIHGNVAEWTFQENKAEPGRRGLKPQYDLSVTLQQIATTRLVCMEFWSKAVLVKGKNLVGATITLPIGTAEKPHERNLDLSNGVSNSVHSPQLS